jgi:hypothetical protein
VTIQQRDNANTVVDSKFREPIQQAARKSNVTLNGQAKWFSDEELRMRKGGAEQESDGYVLFRFVDLAAAGATITQGDRIIKIGLIDTDVYVTKLQQEGHYPDQGGATLVKAFFQDRTPAKQNRGNL